MLMFYRTVQIRCRSSLSDIIISVINVYLSLWLIGTVRAEPETVTSRAWVQSPDPAEKNYFRITGAHALRLIYRTGKRV